MAVLAEQACVVAGERDEVHEACWGFEWPGPGSGGCGGFGGDEAVEVLRVGFQWVDCWEGLLVMGKSWVLRREEAFREVEVCWVPKAEMRVVGRIICCFFCCFLSGKRAAAVRSPSGIVAPAIFAPAIVTPAAVVHADVFLTYAIARRGNESRFTAFPYSVFMVVVRGGGPWISEGLREMISHGVLVIVGLFSGLDVLIGLGVVVEQSWLGAGHGLIPRVRICSFWVESLQYLVEK